MDSKLCSRRTLHWSIYKYRISQTIYFYLSDLSESLYWRIVVSPTNSTFSYAKREMLQMVALDTTYNSYDLKATLMFFCPSNNLEMIIIMSNTLFKDHLLLSFNLQSSSSIYPIFSAFCSSNLQSHQRFQFSYKETSLKRRQLLCLDSFEAFC